MRRLVVGTAVLGVLGGGLAAPALAGGSAATDSPTTLCVQLPLYKPKDPNAPGYCVWIPGAAQR